MRKFLPLLFLFISVSLFAQPKDGLWLAPACKPRLYGLHDQNGNTVLEAKYNYLLAQDGNGWIALSNGKYGVINSKGDWLIRPQYQAMLQYSHGKAVAGKRMLKKDLTVYQLNDYHRTEDDSTTLYGVIDESGVWVIDAAYDYLYLCDDGSVEYTDQFGKYGFLNPDGSVLLRAQYNYATPMYNGVTVIVEGGVNYNSDYGDRSMGTMGKYFVVDRTGKKLNEQPYDMIRNFSEGRVAFNKGGIWKRKRYGSPAKLVGGKWGFLDANAKEIVPAMYDYVYDYENGKAKVRLGDRTFWIDKDGKECAPPDAAPKEEFTVVCEPGFWGYIDLSGNWAIQPQFYQAEDFSEGLAAAMPLHTTDMECDQAKEEGDYYYGGYDDDEGYLVRPRINLFGIGRTYRDNSIYDDEPVQKEKRRLAGYIDATGNMVIEPKYEVAMPFKNGRAYVCFRGQWGVIDRKGNWIVAPVLDWPSDLSYEKAYYGRYSYEGESAYLYDSPSNRTTYETLYQFSEGMGVIHKFGAYGFIDTTGKIVISPVYDEVLPFHQGLAAVRHGDNWGYIDKTGKEVIALKYRSAGSFTNDGIAVVGTVPEKSDVAAPEENMEFESDYNVYYGYIDLSGKWVIRPQFTYAGDFSQGLADAAVDYNPHGYIDRSGKFVIPPKYDNTESFAYGYARVKIRLYEAVYIDKTGKISKVYNSKREPFDNSKPLQRHTDEVSYLIGFVNEKGDEVIPASFQSVGEFVKVK